MAIQEIQLGLGGKFKGGRDRGDVKKTYRVLII
jgi:hypothetical protein